MVLDINEVPQETTNESKSKVANKRPGAERIFLRIQRGESFIFRAPQMFYLSRKRAGNEPEETMGRNLRSQKALTQVLPGRQDTPRISLNPNPRFHSEYYSPTPQ